MCMPTFFSPPFHHQIPVDSSPTLSISAMDHTDAWTSSFLKQKEILVEAHTRPRSSKATHASLQRKYTVDLHVGANMRLPSCFMHMRADT